MRFNIKNIFIKSAIIVITVMGIGLSGCEKYLEGTQLPANTIAATDVYKLDNTTSTVITGIYLAMNNSGPYNGGAGTNIGYTLGLYADELKSVLSNNFADVFYKNAIQSGQSPYWSDLYKKIFIVNTAIDGINTSKGDLIYKNQWLGECYFLRAYFYYLLVNYYGDVPLALTNDYTINNSLARAPQAQVYQQIITDLKQAQTLLSVDYRNGYGVSTTNRFRPNRAVATALLSRVYLYVKDWANAEASATELITNTDYSLLPLTQVFLANSKETIWALANNSAKVSNEYSFYNNGMPALINAPQLPSNFSVFAYMSSQLLNAFESGDGRLANWTRTSTVSAVAPNPATVYYFPAKYKSAATNAEYTILFRLGEQFLIRAEARAMQNKATAVDDVNAIRTRAGGLTSIPANTPQPNLLTTIAKERQTELFTEGGHRFFDLKRTGTIDAVMTAVAPSKGSTWASYMSVFPIPPTDLIQDPNLKPNPGYLQ